MLSALRQISRARSLNPSSVILIGLAFLFILVFIFGFKYANLLAQILPAGAVVLCLGLLIVPQRNLTNILLLALGLSIPFAHFAIFVAAGEGIQWGHLFAALLIIHLIVRLIIGNPLPIAPATPWVIGLVAASFISLFAAIGQPSIHIEEFWKSELQLLFGAFLFLAVTNIRLKKQSLMTLLKAMILMSSGVALFGIYQLPARFLGLPGGAIRLTNPSLSGPVQSAELIANLIRSSSIFSEPSFFGHYMVGMLALSLTAAFHQPRLFGSRNILWLVIAVQIIGLVLSFSMGSFYIFAGLILIMFLTERGVFRAKLALTLIVFAALGIAAMLSIEFISGLQIREMLTERAYGIYKFAMGDQSYMVTSESLFQRIDTAKIALNVWKDHPIIGVGLGSYTLVSYIYGEWNLFGFPANTLVNTLAETGLIGFIALLGLGISSIHGLWRIFRKKPSMSIGDDAIRLAARMVFYLVAIEFLYFHVINSFYWLSTWFYFGLGGLIVIMARQISQAERLQD